VPSSQTIKIKTNKKAEELELLYQQISDYRSGKNQTVSRTKVLEQLEANHNTDWLLAIELYELAHKEQQTDLCERILNYLENVKRIRPEVGLLIDNGLAIVNDTQVVKQGV